MVVHSSPAFKKMKSKLFNSWPRHSPPPSRCFCPCCHIAGSIGGAKVLVLSLKQKRWSYQDPNPNSVAVKAEWRYGWGDTSFPAFFSRNVGPFSRKVEPLGHHTPTKERENWFESSGSRTSAYRSRALIFRVETFVSQNWWYWSLCTALINPRVISAYSGPDDTKSMCPIPMWKFSAVFKDLIHSMTLVTPDASIVTDFEDHTILRPWACLRGSLPSDMFHSELVRLSAV